MELSEQEAVHAAPGSSGNWRDPPDDVVAMADVDAVVDMPDAPL